MSEFAFHGTVPQHLSWGKRGALFLRPVWPNLPESTMPHTSAQSLLILLGIHRRTHLHKSTARGWAETSHFGNSQVAQRSRGGKDAWGKAGGEESAYALSYLLGGPNS